MKKRIIVIGGGEIRNKETLSIDQKIVKISKKKSPKVLFIPTASSDSEGYIKSMDEYYGTELGCNMSHLLLLSHKYSQSKLESLILDADIIYVGGGNTIMMLEVWKKFGVDILLKKAWEKGIILTGLSAGGICWFEYGMSDYQSFLSPDTWEYQRISGLGFIKGVHFPHYNEKKDGISKSQLFKNLLQDGENGIAIDNNCALEFFEDSILLFSSEGSGNAYLVTKNSEKLF